MFTLIALLASAAAVAAGSYVISTGRRGRAGHQEFVRSGVQTRARVLELRSREWLHHGHTVADQQVWHPYVEFALPDGTPIRAESMTGARPAPARVGDLVPVVYDPTSPERVMVVQGLARPGLAGGMTVVVGFGMVGVGLAVFGFWALLKLVLKVPI